MSTSQAFACAKWLGKPASDVHTSVTEWPDLPVVTSGDPYMMSQAEQDRLSSESTLVAGLCVAFERDRIPRTTSRIARAKPRASSLRTGSGRRRSRSGAAGIGGGQMAPLVVRIEDARWVDGKLSAAGLEPLPLEQLAKAAHELGLVTGAAVHGFNRWQWSEAEFEIAGAVERLPVDGLALRHGEGKDAAKTASFKVLDRKRVFIPPVARNNADVTYYSAVGTLVELAVDTGSGEVELLSHHSIVECGNLISPQLVSGQLQGGLAMGIGHALHEYLPLYEDGPGNGAWNFNRYRIPRAADVAVWKQTGEILPPLTETDPPKGMAEVTMIPVVGAIVNGHRARDRTSLHRPAGHASTDSGRTRMTPF